jgi:glycosyltransferase involved in cell wall biosynthesis
MSVIWIVNHYAGGPSHQATRSFDFAKQFGEQGHDVTIFASSFSHYTLHDVQSHKGWLPASEEIDGVKFVWVKTYPYTANDWRRSLNMLTFTAGTLWAGLTRRQRPDAVFGVTVHPLAAWAGWLLAKLKKGRFFLEVTDLWPDTLIEMGAIRPRGISARIMAGFERFLMNRAQHIIMYWPHADLYTTKLGIPREKVVWVPHCVDLSRYQPPTDYHGDYEEPFTIMYAGGLTSEYGLEAVISAAHILQERGETRAKFVLMGGGTDKEALQAAAAELSLGNVEFRPAVPKTELSSAMRDADAFVFTRQGLQMFKEYGISNNKLCDYFAGGRPILYACEARNNPIEDAGAGISVAAENPTALADAVVQMLELPAEERARMGTAGYAHALANHDVRKLASKVLELL